MLIFFEYELKKLLTAIIENSFTEPIKEISITSEYEIPYDDKLNLKLLTPDDSISRIHFKSSFENINSFEGDLFINITDYLSVELFHVRFIYKENGKNPACLYHIYDLYKPNSGNQLFEVSGEEANVSQYEFIYYDKTIGKIFTNSTILKVLQDISVEIIRTYYTNKQRNKT